MVTWAYPNGLRLQLNIGFRCIFHLNDKQATYRLSRDNYYLLSTINVPLKRQDFKKLYKYLM